MLELPSYNDVSPDGLFQKLSAVRVFPNIRAPDGHGYFAHSIGAASPASA